ncbi:unannotated protein [freshwater metagenome]|uniref:Unannotated protein n=1 Tax=freshwater metagenome TaxID=449393 RepID=A0A6J7ISW9_9ZZZZ|nr:transcriptional regulator [Actinomycetota bacterium]
MPTPPPPKRHPYDQWSPDARALDLVGDKWTLLIVRDLAGGPRRFVDLQRTLPGISTEQLRSRLNRMVADDLLTRSRYREVPPRVDYELTDRSRALLPVVAELARWGRRWAWGLPRPGERVDIGAILRADVGRPAPRNLNTTVELHVIEDAGPSIHTMTARGGHLGYSELPAAHPDARIAGPVAAYVAAFGPTPSAEGLRVEGDRRAAGAMLRLLSATT